MHFFAYRYANKGYVGEFFPTSFLSLFTLSSKYMHQLRAYKNQQCCRRCFQMDHFRVVLRSDRLRLVHCNFSSSIAKQLHLPIQFVVAKQIHIPIQFVVANLVRCCAICPFHHSMHRLLSFKNLECFH